MDNWSPGEAVTVQSGVIAPAMGRRMQEIRARPHMSIKNLLDFIKDQ
jgi:hypothetical protein